jgi:hypothetical protein
MSSHEFTEWQAYFRHDPFGNDRFDMLVALVCWTVANSLRPKGATPIPLENFVIDWHEAMTPVDLETKINAVFGGLA